MSEELAQVFIRDPFYGYSDEDAATEETLSENFKAGLVAEYGLEFQFISIGAGAAVPSFFTSLGILPYLSMGIYVFFQGKNINDAIDGWVALAHRLQRFIHRHPTFDRNGAAVLAVKKVLERFDRTPGSIRFVGYRCLDRIGLGFPDDVDPGPLNEFEDPPSRVLVSQIQVFQIVADNRVFRVFVERDEITVKEISTEA
ncbi:MAG: hypothetical protein ACLPN5_06545 [Roseiarcus sp.]